MQSTRLLGLLFDKRRGFEEIYTSVEIFSKNASFPSEFYCWHIKFAFRTFFYTQISKSNTFNLLKINQTVRVYFSNILRVSI